MTMQIASHVSNEGSLFLEELDPVDAWKLDELDQLSDLESVRSAWGRADEPES